MSATELSPRQRARLSWVCRCGDDGVGAPVNRPNAALLASYRALERRGYITLVASGGAMDLATGRAAWDYEARITEKGRDVLNRAEGPFRDVDATHRVNK